MSLVSRPRGQQLLRSTADYHPEYAHTGEYTACHTFPSPPLPGFFSCSVASLPSYSFLALDYSLNVPHIQLSSLSCCPFFTNWEKNHRPNINWKKHINRRDHVIMPIPKGLRSKTTSSPLSKPAHYALQHSTNTGTAVIRWVNHELPLQNPGRTTVRTSKWQSICLNIFLHVESSGNGQSAMNSLPFLRNGCDFRLFLKLWTMFFLSVYLTYKW